MSVLDRLSSSLALERRGGMCGIAHDRHSVFVIVRCGRMIPRRPSGQVKRVQELEQSTGQIIQIEPSPQKKRLSYLNRALRRWAPPIKQLGQLAIIAWLDPILMLPILMFIIHDDNIKMLAEFDGISLAQLCRVSTA